MSVEEKTQTDEQRRKAAESLREHDRTAAQAQEVKSPYQSSAGQGGAYSRPARARGTKREGNGARLEGVRRLGEAARPRHMGRWTQ